MIKPKRKKVHREWLENQLAKCERRIQKIAEQAYYLRQAIEILDKQEAVRNESKGEMTDAIHNSGIEAALESRETNQNAGESQLPNNDGIEAVLGQQSTELPSN